MKRVSFKVAKALKEAGYPQGNTDYVYATRTYYDEDVEKHIKEGCLVYYPIIPILHYVDAPTYLEAWLWLWREKKLNLSPIYWNSDKSWHVAGFIKDKFSDPEEAIIGAIDYLVNSDLIK